MGDSQKKIKYTLPCSFCCCALLRIVEVTWLTSLIVDCQIERDSGDDTILRCLFAIAVNRSANYTSDTATLKRLVASIMYIAQLRPRDATSAFMSW